MTDLPEFADPRRQRELMRELLDERHAEMERHGPRAHSPLHRPSDTAPRPVAAFEAHQAKDGTWVGISRAFGSTLTARSASGRGDWELVSLIHAGGTPDSTQQIVPAGVAERLDHEVAKARRQGSTAP